MTSMKNRNAQTRTAIPMVTDQAILDTLGGRLPLEAVLDAGELSDDQYEKLFELFSTEMPYGTQKARTGDPTVWILEQLENLNSRLIPYQEDQK
jgi:hypothetical protein